MLLVGHSIRGRKGREIVSGIVTLLWLSVGYLGAGPAGMGLVTSVVGLLVWFIGCLVGVPHVI